MADLTFSVGDIVRITTRDLEDKKVHATPFEGIVIAKNKRTADKTVVVRKIAADNIAVERIFPLNSPTIEAIKVIKKGSAKRAKLYYLRHGSAKS